MSSSVENYAQALIQAALGKWLEQLAAVQRTLRRNPELTGVLNDPSSSPTVRASAIHQLLPANAAPEVTKFVRLLAQQGDLRLLEQVQRSVRTHLPSFDDNSHVVVRSARELSESERKKLEAKLRRRHGDGLQFRYEVDPELLGGLRIRIGDQVIDHSVAARLDALQAQLVG